MIYGLMVVRNEAGRYLDCCLQWHLQFLDAIHLYDDGSTDGTPELAAALGVVVRRRPDDVPQFLQNEGLVRQASWEGFLLDIGPEDGDWVLAIDADEFFVSDDFEGDVLRRLCDEADRWDSNSVIMPIPEVFAVSERDGYLVEPQVRLDGYWGTIAGRRLFRHQDGGSFSPKAMASGSAPTYADGEMGTQGRAYLLHYGYAVADDRVHKYARYAATSSGHGSPHIQSILATPVLAPWNGPHFKVWRGTQ